MPSPPAPDRTEPGTAAGAGLGGLVWSAVPSLVAFAVAGTFLLLAGTIRGLEGAYPVVLAVVVLLLGLVNLVRDLLAAVRGGEETPEPGADGVNEVPGDEVPLTRPVVLRLLAFVAVLLAALALLEPLGFFPAMVVMVVGSLVCFGERRPLVVAAATALTVGTAYLVFVRLLAVPFTPGLLGLA